MRNDLSNASYMILPKSVHVSVALGNETDCKWRHDKNTSSILVTMVYERTCLQNNEYLNIECRLRVEILL